MPTTTVTISGNVADLVGDVFTGRSVRVLVESSEPLSVGTVPGGVRLNPHYPASIDSNGDLTVEVPVTSGGSPLYQLRFEGQSGAEAQRETLGWFDMTADDTLEGIRDRTFTPATVTPTLVADVTAAAASVMREQNNGVAGLDGTGKLFASRVPDLSATYATKAGANVFTGKQEFKGSFTNPFDSHVWIAPPVKANPTNLTQGLYNVHRVSADMGAMVHDAMATELIVYSGTNTSFLNAFESTVKLEDAGASINDMRAGTFNFAFSGDAGGTVTSAIILAAQATPALPAGLTIQNLYGLYIEQQTRGTNNWSVFAPGGVSLFGTVMLDSAAPSSARAVQFTTNKSLRWLVRATADAESGANVGTDFEIAARTDAGGANFTPVRIIRSSGRVEVNNGLKVTGNIGFYGTTPVAKPTVSGSRGGNAALASLLTQLASQGLITDGSAA